MFKWQIQRKIKKIKKEIVWIEERMHRPCSACIQALLEGKEMPQEEVYYHKMYMSQIDELRKQVRDLEKLLDEN